MPDISLKSTTCALSSQCKILCSHGIISKRRLHSWSNCRLGLHIGLLFSLWLQWLVIQVYRGEADAPVCLRVHDGFHWKVWSAPWIYTIKDHVLHCEMQWRRSSFWTKLYVGFIIRLICSFGCHVWLLRCAEANHIYLNPHFCGYYFVSVKVISCWKRYSHSIIVLLLLLFHELYSHRRYPWLWQAAELVAFYSGLPHHVISKKTNSSIFYALESFFRGWNIVYFEHFYS